MSEKKNIGHRVSFGALSIFLKNFPAKPHHNKSTFGCNFHDWSWFSFPPFEGFCVWRRNVQGRKEWPDSRCTTPSMKHSCGKANGYERHCRLDEYARMHTKFCQLWYPSLALKKKSKAAWIILPNPSFVFTSKVLGPRVAGPRCCLEVKTSFIALQWAASHSMSKRLASPQRNSPRVIVKRSNPLQSKQPCSSCSMTKPMSTIQRPSTTLQRTRGLAFGVRVSAWHTASPSTVSVPLLDTRRCGRLWQDLVRSFPFKRWSIVARPPSRPTQLTDTGTDQESSKGLDDHRSASCSRTAKEALQATGMIWRDRDQASPVGNARSAECDVTTVPSHLNT